MNKQVYTDMVEAADCLEYLGKLSQVIFTEVEPRNGITDEHTGATLAYVMGLLGKRLNADLAELYEPSLINSQQSADGKRGQK